MTEKHAKNNIRRPVNNHAQLVELKIHEIWTHLRIAVKKKKVYLH